MTPTDARQKGCVVSFLLLNTYIFDIQAFRFPLSRHALCKKHSHETAKTHHRVGGPGFGSEHRWLHLDAVRHASIRRASSATSARQPDK